MKKGLSALIIVGAVLLTAGGALFAVAAANNMLSTDGSLVTKEYEFDGTFTKLNIAIDIADLEFKKSNDTNCQVICHEKEKMFHEVKVEDQTLSIQAKDTSEWYEHIFNFTNGMKVTVYLPLDVYSDVKIASSTGDITCYEGFTFTELNASASTGDIKLENVKSNNANISTSTGHQNYKGVKVNNQFLLVASTGDVSLENCEVGGLLKVNTSTGHITANGVRCTNASFEASTGKVKLDDFVAVSELSIKTSTGDVTFKNIDADTIKIKTNTGNVKGNILTDKHFVVSTDTGKTNYPKYSTGSLCEITTDTGDIDITVGAN